MKVEGEISIGGETYQSPAIKGEDDLIVALPEETITRRESKLDASFRKTQRKLESNDHVTADDVEITYTSYEEIGS